MKQKSILLLLPLVHFARHDIIVMPFTKMNKIVTINTIPLHLILMRKLFFLVLLICISKIAAQEFPSITPPSPEIEAIAKYNDYKLNSFTGIPSINVPLYVIKSGDITLPIDLNYFAGGFRVTEESSWIGLGWTLSCNAFLSSTIRGTGDFDYRGYSLTKRVPDITPANGFYDWYQLGSSSAKLPQQPYVDGKKEDYSSLFGVGFDWEPDIYRINAFDLNAKFVLDYDERAHFNDNELNLKVVRNNDSWIVTTTNGFRYYFEDKETVYNYQTKLTSNSTFYLSKIISPLGKEVRFEYKLYPDRIFSSSVSFNIDISSDPNTPTIKEGFNTSDEEQWSYFDYAPLYLEKIIYDEGYVEFTTGDREDLTNAKKLKQIKVYDYNDKLIKSFDFNTNYFISPPYKGKTNVPSLKRLKLESVVENKGNDEKAYSFEYNEKVLPSKNSYARDYWGFYNGSDDNKHLIPSIKSVLPLYSHIKGDNVYRAEFVNKKGANREPNEEFSDACMLEKIIYPTKGSTEFEFESNEYVSDPVSSEEGEFLTRKKVYNKTYYAPNKTLEETGDKVVNLDLEYQTPVKVVLKVSGYHAGRFNDEYYVDVSYRTPKKVHELGDYNPNILENAGKRIYAGTTSNFGHDLEYEFYMNPNVDGINYPPYKFEIHMPDSNKYPNDIVSLSVSIELTYFDKKKNKEGENIKGGGLRIKSITDETKTEKIIKTYVYSTLDKTKNSTVTTGVLKTPLRYYYVGRNYLLDLQLVANYTFLTSNNTNVAAFGDKHIVGYSEIIENYNRVSRYGKIPSIGVKKSYFHNHRNGVYYQDIRKWYPNVTTFQLDGKEYKTEIYDDDYNLIRSTEMVYKTLKESFISGIAKEGIQAPFGIPEYGLVFGALFQYPLFSRWEPLEKSINMEIFDDQAVTTVTEYQYNEESQQLIKSNSTDSKGTVVETKSWFPDDVLNINSLGEELTVIELQAIRRLQKDSDEHRIDQSIQTEKTINGAKTIQRTNFKTWENGITLPEFIQTAKADNILEDRLTYLNYNEEGQPLEIAKTDGTHTIYVWGYNKQYPIAKITNASYIGISTSAQKAINTAVTASNSDISPSTELDLLDKLKLLRNDSYFATAQITTYTYDPLIGVTSITDPSGYTMTYHYDKNNRLEFVKDADGNLVSQNKYNYRKTK